jgi:hypothetical protein
VQRSCLSQSLKVNYEAGRFLQYGGTIRRAVWLLVIAVSLPAYKASVSLSGIKITVQEISGSHSGYCKNYSLWGCDVLQFG